jgi:hypothetical protein
MRRYLYVAAIFVAIMALVELNFLTLGKDSPISIGLGLAIILGGMGMMIWMIWFWKPLCPQCRSARAKFVYPDRKNERLHCNACGFDEPTGWQRGGSDGV